MELLTVSTLRSLHGFPTRSGGVSSPPFDSLNSARAVGDRPEHVDENLRRLAAAAKVASPIVTVTQVHGVRVLEASAVTEGTEADGLFTQRPGRAVGVRTADCVPVLLEERQSGAVAAVHAGWRGVDGRIVSEAVRALRTFGDDLWVGLGPCIQACCFEVSGDLPKRFAQGFGPSVVHGGEGRVTVDLHAALQITLHELGLEATRVERRAECTVCDARFFSHRRDRGVTGRHLSFIACAPEL